MRLGIALEKGSRTEVRSVRILARLAHAADLTGKAVDSGSRVAQLHLRLQALGNALRQKLRTRHDVWPNLISTKCRMCRTLARSCCASWSRPWRPSLVVSRLMFSPLVRTFRWRTRIPLNPYAAVADRGDAFNPRLAIPSGVARPAFPTLPLAFTLTPHLIGHRGSPTKGLPIAGVSKLASTVSAYA